MNNCDIIINYIPNDNPNDIKITRLCNLHNEMKIETIKKILRRIYNYNIYSQILYIDNFEIPNDFSIYDIPINYPNNNIYEINLKLTQPLNLVIYLYNTNLFNILVYPSNTISDIRNKIIIKLKKKTKFHLIYNNIKLDNYKTIGEYNIINNSIINIIFDIKSDIFIKK